MTDTREQPRWIDYVPVDEIVPALRNPRRHENLDDVKASIRHSGFVESAVHDGRTGRILAGHGRTKALVEMSAADEPLPEGVMLGADGRWLMPVTHGWSSRDDDEAERMVIWLNRAPERGGWDEGLLTDMLDSMAVTDLGLDGTGWSVEELDALKAEPATTNVREHERKLADRDDIDELPPVPDEPITKRGDVWLLGDNRLMCGDCRDADDVDTLFAGRKACVAFTSPPYADRRDYDASSGFEPIPADKYVAWFELVQSNVERVLDDRGSWFVNIKEHCEDGQRVLYVKDLTLTHVREWGWSLVDELCWVKGSAFGAWPNRFKNGWEPVFHYTRGGSITFNPLANGTPTDHLIVSATATHFGFTRDRGFVGNDQPLDVTSGIARPSNVVRVMSGGYGAHSAAFPVALPAWFVRAFSDEGDVVFDPFSGSGSTLIAAHDEQRVGFGLELSPAYVDVTLARWEKLTGIVPVLESTGAARSFLAG